MLLNTANSPLRLIDEFLFCGEINEDGVLFRRTACDRRRGQANGGFGEYSAPGAGLDDGGTV
jgi:hypothetical protein